MNTSEVIANVILASIIIITYWFQRKKIDALKTSINSHKDVISAQKEIIDGMKKAHEVVNPDKYKNHIDFLEEAKEKEIVRTRQEIEEKMGEKLQDVQEKSKIGLKILLNQYTGLMEFAFSAFIMSIQKTDYNWSMN